MAGRTAGPLGRTFYLGYRFIPANFKLRRIEMDLKIEKLTQVRKDVSILSRVGWYA
jgi:hypothetical protein